MKLNVKLAEIAGIHTGDGYLRRGKREELDISGHVDERLYYDEHVVPLFEHYFNIRIKGQYFKGRNTYGFVIRNRVVTRFFHESLGFPCGAKSLTVQVPKAILKSRELMISFLRGYFDTDGCITFRSADKNKNYSFWKKNYRYYPKVLFSTVSHNLFKDLQELLSQLGFTFSLHSYQPKRGNENRKYIITLNGETNVRNWFELVGSKNYSKVFSYQIWCKLGHCPANLTIRDKENILKEIENSGVTKGP